MKQAFDEVGEVLKSIKGDRRKNSKVIEFDRKADCLNDWCVVCSTRGRLRMMYVQSEAGALTTQK